MSTWQYLIRFTATDGKNYYSNLSTNEDAQHLIGAEVTAFDTFEDLTRTQDSKQATIQDLLAPTISEDAEIICIGINYAEHAKEANLQVPQDPVMWYKPKRAFGAYGNVQVPSAAANGFLDFEGELVIVTSKDARDVSQENASNYILGYTIGNDLTARTYQDPKRAGGQFTRCKAFDGFAPLGPVLVNATIFGDRTSKRILTKVNGKVFQDSAIDLINGPEKLISFLSQGTTLPAGTCIMTGSPPGIGFFREPKYNLKDNDVVEVNISSIGTLVNTMRFE